MFLAVSTCAGICENDRFAVGFNHVFHVAACFVELRLDRLVPMQIRTAVYGCVVNFSHTESTIITALSIAGMTVLLCEHD